jgi:hypothetical protein
MNDMGDQVSKTKQKILDESPALEAKYLDLLTKLELKKSGDKFLVRVSDIKRDLEAIMKVPACDRLPEVDDSGSVRSKHNSKDALR